MQAKGREVESDKMGATGSGHKGLFRFVSWGATDHGEMKWLWDTGIIAISIW